MNEGFREAVDAVLEAMAEDPQSDESRRRLNRVQELNGVAADDRSSYREHSLVQSVAKSHDMSLDEAYAYLVAHGFL